MSLDIMSAFTNEPPELDFIWPGFLAGTVGALVAPGATGKSFFALEVAMSVACRTGGGDLVKIAPKRTGRVIYLSGEDPAPALIRRIHSIGQHLKQPAREAIAENLILEPVMGKRLNVMDAAHLRRVINYCEGARLIVLDTLSRIHCLDENSNGDMALLVSVLESIASQTGAAVLYLHHVNKSSAKDGQTDQQQSARGASALVDNARWCGYVAKMTETEAKRFSVHDISGTPIGDRRNYFVRFGVSKQNYDAPPFDRWYQRHDGGVLLPVELIDVSKKMKKDATAEGAAMAFDLTHARLDPAHCLAPGLFRSLKRGDRKKLKLDVIYHYGDGERIEFSGPEPLGADDLRILQGLVALGGPKGIILTSEPSLEPAKQLRLLLDLKWEAAESDGLVVKGSYRTLASPPRQNSCRLNRTDE